MGRTAHIEVDTVEPGLYDVVVDDFTSARSYRVMLSDDYFEQRAKGRSRESFVLDAFRFLVAREPKESILSSFDIGDISMYFPEFEKEI